MLIIKPINLHDRGPLVGVWQTFLRGKGLYRYRIDNHFAEGTKEATMAYEQQNGLTQDGVVDDMLWSIAKHEGLLLATKAQEILDSNLYPELPKFRPLSYEERQNRWGEIEFQAEPLGGNPEHIRITNDWANNNIEAVCVPQIASLSKIIGARHGWSLTGVINWHKRGVENLLGFFDYVDRAGLLGKLRSFGGSWVPRTIRGGSTLSNHAHAVAFDINVPWNWMGNKPTPPGKYGSVMDLVPIANAWGFFWGGHFSMDDEYDLGRRVDGMHFELTRPDMRPAQPPDYYSAAFWSRV